MMTLLYKEIRLAAHPTSIVFAFLGCLVLVPAYPYSIIFMFGCLAPYITFLNARETNDAWYTAILPVTKRESVLGKCLLIVSVQIFQLLFSIPFAFLRNALSIENNPVGLDATLAWYGFGLIVYAVFDLVFFPTSYGSVDDCGGGSRPYTGTRLVGQLSAEIFADAVTYIGCRHPLLHGVPITCLSYVYKTCR